MNDATRCKKWISMMIGGAMALTVSGALLARDPESTSAVPPGTRALALPRTRASINPVRWERRRESWQGSRRQSARRSRQQARRAGKDRGVNQPGAAGNVGGAGPGKDAGVNQPGAAGNRGGVGR